MEQESDMETVYFPKDSRAVQDRQFLRDHFPDRSARTYNPFSLNEADRAVSIIFRCASACRNVLDPAVTAEIRSVLDAVLHLPSEGKNFTDLCARDVSSQCVVDGAFALDSNFAFSVASDLVTFPILNGSDLSTSISGANVSHGGLLQSATVLKLSFKLAHNDQVSKGWAGRVMEHLQKTNLSWTELAYEAPDSLNDELDKSTKGDIVYFSLTITLVCIYASVVSTGGNPVSTRGALAFGGILAAGLGIVGSMGLLCAAGLKFVNIVGVVPFLIIGIGVDDMFLLMSAWSENLPTDKEKQTVAHVPEILGNTLKTAGIGITITSLTDFLAFAVGSFSVFRGVTSFSLYAGVAVLFCYIANASLFSACLALHGRRVYSSRHTYTCLVTKPRKELEREGKSAVYALLCGGSPPEKEGDDHSVFEKVPSKLLPRLFRHGAVNVVIIVVFLAYLAVSIYGALQLQQGLLLQNLVQDTSYYNKYLLLKDQYFPNRIPVAFVVTESRDYSAAGVGDKLLELLSAAKSGSGINPHFSRCWLETYRSSSFINLTSPGDFVGNLRLFLDYVPEFQADVVLDSSNKSVLASRCFVLSEPSSDQYVNAEMMKRMRQLADDSSLPVKAYHSSFVAFEQFLAVLPATLQLVGIAVGVMTIVTFLLLPHPFMVLLVVITIVMILVGIFGFMHFWGLTLSSITMIHLVMSVGFSVDFSAHVCASYLMSKKQSRRERAVDAIHHAAAPILNGAVSTLLGVLMLLASSSYIFLSFFKVMVLVIVFGLVHAVFFLPAVLSVLGPQGSSPKAGETRVGSAQQQGLQRHNAAYTADENISVSLSR